MSVRKTFVSLLHEEMRENDNIVFVVGDLGYGHFDEIREEFPDRVINPGAAEQLMMGMSIGLAQEGKLVVCYSMTPFTLYRPFEFIRNYVDYEKIPVKLVGAVLVRDPKVGRSGVKDDVEALSATGPSVVLAGVLISATCIVLGLRPPA